jgi:6-phosphogluconolactonase
MKFSKMSQLVLVSALGLVSASALSGCAIVTVDYLFVADSSGTSAGSTGQIQSFAVDSESGAIRPAGATVPSGGNQPVSMVTTTDYANLYVANASNNSVVHFLVNYDGSLTQKESVTVPFVPASIAISQGATSNPDNTTLYVAGSASGTNPASVAEVAVYPISSGALGSVAQTITLAVPGFTSDAMVATGVTALPNGQGVYVSAYDESAYNASCPSCVTSSANPGWVFAFSTSSSGALTAVSGSPYEAGIKPSALIADPTNRFLYVTDFASNELIGFGIQSPASLNLLVAGPFKTGSQPSAIVIDPRAIYIYLANSLSSSLSAYTISLPTGTPSAIVNVTGSASTLTDTQPVAITIDPALGRFIYTANYLGNSVSGFQINPNTGALTYTQATPYPTGANPTALVAVPHGNHAVQVVTP